MSTTPLTSAPRGKTLSGHALSQLKELLLSGQVMPGQLLSLRTTAEAMGISVMPVREAVAQLVGEQALEVTPNRSVRVPILSAEQYTEVTNIRLELEGYAVQQAALIAPTSLIARLRKLNARLAREMEATNPDSAAVVMLNKALHFQVYENANMPLLLRMIESLWLRIGPILNYDIHAGSERTVKKTAYEHHIRLIDALESRDAEAARAALQSDIKSAYQHILEKQYAQDGEARRAGHGS
ncbi:GntR family transcriptional regulator [Pollutimonas harenae]|uniref:GntR family transcriptional regulator n=1 Tax=Pollutimonas harenae TaxID=657015 RepID=A0A853GVA7_9BURK|nr:GntR family transcriptional regulator [Pollutimonas harenae]NYT84716.1 GntR family transcriptional regulator [Pollutimonas harenae]TEA72882.1 GntR family transcriptional regulator [Pollutimonas harenae]